MAANRTVITNPFYADGEGENLSAALSPAAEAESGGDDGAEDVAPSEEPMSPGKRSLWDDPAQDKKEPEHPPLKQMLVDAWTLMTDGKNAVAGVAAAMHVNIYLFALALILSTPYFTPMATLQVAVLGTIILQVVQSFMSPYNEFAIANCDSVPAAVMVTVIETAAAKVEFMFEEDQQAAREQYELDNNYTHTVMLAQQCGPCESLSAARREAALCPDVAECTDETKYLPPVGGVAAMGSMYQLGDYSSPGSSDPGYAGPGAYAFKQCWEDGAYFRPGVEGEEPVLCSDRAHSTIMACLMMANMFVSISLGLLSSGHAARVIAFVPTTVQAAFLAGVGFKILKMGLFFMVTKAEVKQLFALGLAGGDFGDLATIFLMCVIVMGLALLINIVEIKMHHSKIKDWVWPIMLLLLTIVFYIFLGSYAAGLGISLTEAHQHANSPGKTKAEMLSPVNPNQQPLTWAEDSSFPGLPRNMGWLLDDEKAAVTSAGGGVVTCYEDITRFDCYNATGALVEGVFVCPDPDEECDLKGMCTAAGGVDWMKSAQALVSDKADLDACKDVRGDALKTRDACEAVRRTKFPSERACTWSDAGEPGLLFSAVGHILPQFAHFKPSTIYWGAFFNVTQLMNLILLDIITILAILLNTSAIEEETNRDIDFDQELKCVATGNFVSSIFGSFTGFSSAAKSLLCEGMGGEHYSGLWAAGYFTGFLFFGKYIAMIIPIPVIGGFISAIGMELLAEWLWHMRHKLTRSEMYELLLLFTLMCINFIAGFIFGMMLSLLAFTARYVQTPVVKTALTGADYQGKALRDWKSKTILLRYGTEILTLRLQGFIFFATAERLRITIMDMLRKKKQVGKPITWLILDFHMVDNIDATAIKKLKKCVQFCKEGGVTVILTALTHDMHHSMEHDEISPHHFDNLKIMEDADIGVEWASDQILASPNHQINFMKRDPVSGRHTIKTIGNGLMTYIRVGFGKFVHGEAFDSVNFREGGTRMEFNKGDVIATQQNYHTTNEHLYYIVQGSCIKMHESEFTTKRVEKRYKGTIIGELAFFLKAPRGDTIIADEDGTVVYEYTNAQYEKLRDEFPYIGEHLLKSALQKMSDTIKRLNQENHLLMVMDGVDIVGDEETEKLLETNSIGDTQVAEKQLAKKGKFQRGHEGKIDYGKEEDTAASRQRREAGVVEAEGADHKHTGFGMLDDLDENLTAEQIRQRQNAGTLSVE